jgi:hypothetical protein
MVLLRRALAEEEPVRTSGQAVISQAHHGTALLELPQPTRQRPTEKVPLQHQPRERHPPFRALLGLHAGGVPVGNGAGEPVPVERDDRELRHRPEAAWQLPGELVAAEVDLDAPPSGASSTASSRLEPRRSCCSDGCASAAPGSRPTARCPRGPAPGPREARTAPRRAAGRMLGINHRLLLGSNIGFFVDQPLTLLSINRQLYHL